ncbi:MAG: hypothetical protein CR984_01825 [Proteobacteria bacterium]|nr:MAG: hypothetical protein CR984_01825 [Pseudomonadota bacterium]PIE68163.1 MAG: hypothetical protein CSA23_00330 [Deltaproteobacteria bacterium]
MHYKDIKAQVRKQPKTEHPNWYRLNRKEKKLIAPHNVLTKKRQALILGWKANKIVRLSAYLLTARK